MSEPTPTQAEQWRLRFQRLRARARKAVPFVMGVLAAFVALALYGILFPGPAPLTQNDVSQTVANALASATPPPAFSAQAYAAIQPSFVYVQVKTPNANGKVDDGVGSGVIVNQNGDILTALHVVTGANSIQVTFADGTQSSAQVINTQPQNDIAVLHASQSPSQIVPATLGNPNALHIGDEAYVVGNPLGLYGSLSAGVISGVNRSFTPPNSNQKLSNLLQIDAAVNPGNSGGPLLNRYGQVVGIVTALVNPTGQDVFIGIGFAVPINLAGGAAGMPLD
jgi:S1-C subfamily serine protease